MPTNLHRIQVLMSPETHAKVRTLGKFNRRSLSNICNELISYALKQDKFRELLEEAEDEGVKMKPVDDPRTRINQPLTWDEEKIKEEREEQSEEEDKLNFTDAQMQKIAEHLFRLQNGKEKEGEEKKEPMITTEVVMQNRKSRSRAKA